MLQQTGGRQSSWQDPGISIHSLQPAVGTNAVSGRLRWMETVTERTERVLNLTNQHLLLDNSLTFGGFHYDNPREIRGELRYRFGY